MGKVIFHIPHSSMFIPNYIRKDILLSDSELKGELEASTDLHTDIIFKGRDTVRYEFSRFVCDVERFEDDNLETMAKLGMGAVYSKTPSGKELRYLDEVKKKHMVDNYYRPYHAKFEAMVKEKIDKYGECFIIDCHSFNENTSYIDMPDIDICIGVDEYHTPINIVEATVRLLKSMGYSVSINTPFSGSIVPLNYYNKDNRVKSMMIELNRRLYIKAGTEIDEEGMQRIISACNQVMHTIDPDFDPGYK